MDMHLWPQYYELTATLKGREKTSMETIISEQRTHKRLEIPEAVVLSPNFVGQLINISTVGLSFKNTNRVDLPEKCSLDVIIPSYDFHLKQLPVEMVWKKRDDHPGSLAMQTENVGVRFNNLQQSSEMSLEYLFAQFFR